MKSRVAMMFLGVFLLGGCASMSVSSDYDPKADFSSLKTYDWEGPQPITGNPRLDNDLLHERIRNAVERELTLKGYRKVTVDPDFKVAYNVGLENKLDVTTIPTYDYSYPSYYSRVGGFGRYEGYRPSTEVNVYQYEEGTLLLDIVNPETKKLIWRGTAKAEVNAGDSPERKEARVNEAVSKMLAQFPPQK